MADYVSSLTGVAMDAALLDMAEHTSEAYAVGERNGVPVDSSDVTYHNNARYYAQQAQSIAPASVTEAVRWDVAQTALTDANKEMARANIDAGKNGAWTNPNLLDNWYFVGGGTTGNFPINQRGNATYTAQAYAIDRWFLGNGAGTLTFNANYMTFAASAANAYLRQKLQTTLTGTYTLSARVSGTGRCRLLFNDASFNNLSSQAFDITGETIISLTFATTGTPIGGVSLRMDSGNTVNFHSAKLESGTVSTLANDAPPDYGTELLKCQYYAAPLEYTTYSNPFTGIATSTTEFFVEAYFPRSMREINNPTISVTGTAYAIRGGSTGAITSWEAGAINGNHIRLKGTTTNLTANTQVPVYTAGNTLKIFVSADI